MNLVERDFERHSNPVDMIEFVAAAKDWTFERSGDDEIAMTVEGHWTDYHVSFSWMEDCEALHIASAFDIKVPENRITEVMKLLSHVNGQVLMGHFDLWQQEHVIIFRQSLLLAGGAGRRLGRQARRAGHDEYRGHRHARRTAQGEKAHKRSPHVGSLLALIHI